jgi:hypothetical protein
MGLRKGLTGVLAAIVAMAASTAAIALPAEKPVAGKQVHFPNGVWSAVPQVGPNGRVRGGVFAQHPSELAGALEKSNSAAIRAPTGYQFEFPVRAGVVPGLRAGARRNGFAIEPATQ